MKSKRIVEIDIRTGRPVITITRVGREGQPIIRRKRTTGIKSFGRVVRVCTTSPQFGMYPNGTARWVSIER